MVSHSLDCGTCQCFIDQDCETHMDCAWVYECAYLDNAWEPRKEDPDGEER